MKRWFSGLRMVVLLLVGIEGGWGNGSGRMAWGQPASSVQLPSFSYFGVGTSVLVPDRGSTVLGGVGGSASQQGQWGWPGTVGWPGPLVGQRSFSANRAGHLAGISVWIHDFEAMEARLLGQQHPAVPGLLASPSSAQPDTSLLPPGNLGPLPSDAFFPRTDPSQDQAPLVRSTAEQPGRSTAEQPVQSVAELRQQRQAELQQQTEEAALWFQRGQKAQAEGKIGLARIYYQMALRRASRSMQQEIQQRLESLLPSAEATGEKQASGER